MTVPAQVVVQGVVDGAAYGLLAVGVVVVFRTTQVLNLAVAAVGGVAAYLLSGVMDGSGGGAARYAAAFAAGLGVAAVLGAGTGAVAARAGRRAGPPGPLLATGAVLLLVHALLVAGYGEALRTVENPFPRAPLRVGQLVGLDRVVVTAGGAVTVATLLVAGALVAGVLARGGAARRGRAWALGSALGAAGVMLFTTTGPLTPPHLALLGVKGLVVAAFAGFSGVRLCLLGGPLLGVLERWAARSGVDGLEHAVAFAVLAALLLVRSGPRRAPARA